MKQMNNKGQALIMFILLLPVVVFLFIFMVENANILYHKTRLENIVIESCNKTNIQEYIWENEKNATISISENKVKVQTEINSTFANIIGIKTFTIKVSKTCESGDQNG